MNSLKASKKKNTKASNTSKDTELKAYDPIEEGVNARIAAKEQKKKAKKAKIKEKIDMYDMILANLIAGKSIIQPRVKLGNSQLAIGFSNISSEATISKYFMIRQLPDYMQPRMVDYIRNSCILPGVKINFYFYGGPYKINWDSAEMQNKMRIWKEYSAKHSGPIDVFDYRNQRNSDLARRRIIESTRYLNEAELEYKRSLVRVAFVIEVTAERNTEAILNMQSVIYSIKSYCNNADIKLKELRVNMIDWLQTLDPFSLKKKKETTGKMSYKILTDDILANFNSYKQGRVGVEGHCLGIDVLSGGPVLRHFKLDPDAPENWLISAETGGGKSFFVKALLTWLLADNFVVTVLDYEGDEYTNLANYIKAGNPEDVRIISMGKGSTQYFDPCEIPPLTGDTEVDSELKENAINYILALFKIIVAGIDNDLTQWEERVLSTAVSRMYDCAGVTEDPSTWSRSKGLRLSMVYDEVKDIVESKELVDADNDNIKHKAAVRIMESASIYFEEGGSKSGTFKHPISVESIHNAKFIVFSFGMKGADNSLSDRTILALKQLSVASVSIQISNYCKYVRKCFNVKVWEEFQRWQAAEGSGSIISNAMTGGRKRGDVNIVITNDLSSILDDENTVSRRIRQNIQNMAIGKIRDKDVLDQFCQMFSLQDCRESLRKISRANVSDTTLGRQNTGQGNRYRHSFCVIQDNGKKAIVKAMLPTALSRSKIFRTGVDVESRQKR